MFVCYYFSNKKAVPLLGKLERKIVYKPYNKWKFEVKTRNVELVCFLRIVYGGRIYLEMKYVGK